MRNRETPGSLKRKITACKRALRKALAENEVPAVKDYCVAYWRKGIAHHELNLAEMTGHPCLEGYQMEADSARGIWESLMPEYNAEMSRRRSK